MNVSEIISIKGISDGLLIALSPTEEWQSIANELAARLDEKLDFFMGAKVTIDAGERPIPKYELTSLKALLERRGLKLLIVQSSSQTTLDSALALDLRTKSLKIAPASSTEIHQDNGNAQQSDIHFSEDEDVPINPEEHGTQGVMIKRTLRSGRTIHSRGHVVVYGDVNPGAKIIATGDLIIWGKLRGFAHAGAEGDLEAVICALDMSPNFDVGRKTRGACRGAGYLVNPTATL
jgi:septum site-determining protein MinC